MGSETMASGVRIGEWFLWIDTEAALLRGGDRIPIITARRAITGGDVLARAIATPEMVKAFRTVANNIELLAGAEKSDNDDD